MRVEAQRARVQSASEARSAVGSSFRELQIRAGVPLEGVQTTTAAPKLGLRLELDRPWTLAREREQADAEHDAEQHSLDHEVQVALLETCTESLDAHVVAEHELLYARLSEPLERLAAWLAAWSAAGSMEPLAAARAELLLERKRLQRAPAPSRARVHATLGRLPSLADSSSATLDGSDERIRQSLASHGDVAASLAAARAHEARARAERGARIPWLDFVELRHPLRADENDGLEARVAITVPLGVGAEARSQREVHLARAERLEADAKLLELAELTNTQVLMLAAFERDRSHLAMLLQKADAAEAVALRHLEQHRERPDQVAQLLDEAYAVRLAVLDARERAGSAACLLEFATGVSYERWPRVR